MFDQPSTRRIQTYALICSMRWKSHSNLSSKLRRDKTNGETCDEPRMATIDSTDLIRCSFLMPKREDGEYHQARIIEMIQEHNNRTSKDSDHIKFKCFVNNDQYTKKFLPTTKVIPAGKDQLTTM